MIGVLLGAALMLASVSTTGGWYEYTLIDNSGPSLCTPQVRQTLIREGWQTVPSQSDICYLRRPRIHLFP